MNTAKKSSGGGPLDPPFKHNSFRSYYTHKYWTNQYQNIPATKYTILHASSLQNVMKTWKARFCPLYLTLALPPPPPPPFFFCFLVHLSRRLKCTIVITRCPSSVVRPSVCLSVVNFHIFNFYSETAEQNLTKLDRKQDINVLYQVCVFRADRKNKMAALASDWLKHFSTSSLKPLNGIQRNLTGSKISTSSTKFVFFGPIGKTRWPPGLWFAETFSTSALKLLNGIQRNLTWSKISMSSTKFVFFGLIGKTRRPPRSLIGWDIFDFCSETPERNSTKLDRKQDLNVLYQVCVFRADRKNKIAALASYWLRHFRLLL